MKDYHDCSMDKAITGLPDQVIRLRQLIARMELTTYSTAFSGIDSPGTAFAMLRVFAGKKAGVEVKPPKHLHAIEPSPNIYKEQYLILLFCV